MTNEQEHQLQQQQESTLDELRQSAMTTAYALLQLNDGSIDQEHIARLGLFFGRLKPSLEEHAAKIQTLRQERNEALEAFVVTLGQRDDLKEEVIFLRDEVDRLESNSVAAAKDIVVLREERQALRSLLAAQQNMLDEALSPCVDVRDVDTWLQRRRTLRQQVQGLLDRGEDATYGQ